MRAMHPLEDTASATFFFMTDMRSLDRTAPVAREHAPSTTAPGSTRLVYKRATARRRAA